MGQSAPAPGSLARSPPIRGAQVHLDAQVVPRRSRCSPRNIPPAAHALSHPAVNAASVHAALGGARLEVRRELARSLLFNAVADSLSRLWEGDPEGL